MNVTEKYPIHPLAQPFEFFPNNNEKPKMCFLLIHGFTASPSEVKPVGLFLKKEYPYALITSILLKGHGRVNGHEILKNTKYEEWIEQVNSKIENILSKNVPVILIGLSMGTLLITHYLASNKENKGLIKGAIFLSPPFFINSSLFNYIGILKHFMKYQKKGDDSVKFFTQYNLFSYTTRPLSAVHELSKLMKISKNDYNKIKIPMLSYISDKDDTIDIEKVKQFLLSNELMEITIANGLDHIITVFPESLYIFKEMDNWIKEIIK